MKDHLTVSLRLVLGVCSCFAMFSAAKAQNAATPKSTTGRYAGIFLNDVSYARQAGMGEAFTALANGINVMRFNVGGLGSLRHTVLSTHYHNWIEDTQMGALEGAMPWKYGVFGLNLTYFDVGEVTEIDQDFNQTGNVFGSNDLALSLAYGHHLMLFDNPLSFGVGGKWVRQSLAEISGNAFGADAGLLYSIKSLSFGATVQNLTLSKMKFINREYLLPETLRGGVALRLPVGENFRLNLATDVATYIGNSGNDPRIYSGAELRISEVFALRGGYKFHDTELTNWGAGFGLVFPMNWFGRSSTELDYAYRPMDALGDQAHYFSLSFNFGQTEAVSISMNPEELKRIQLELAAAEQARRAAEEARLSAEETEKRLKLLEAELAARLEKARQIAETTEGKIVVEPVEKGNVLVTLRINFDFDKYVIRPTEYETMFKVVDILQTYAGSQVWLSGHTDYIGTDEYNMKLSEARMSSVMIFLDRHGLDRSRFFMPVPYGEWRPLTENRTEEQRFRNRRVEFYIYTGENQPVIPEGSKIETIVVQGDSAIAIVGNGRLNYTSSFLEGPSRLLLKFPKVYIPDPRTIVINRGNYQQARMAFHSEDRSTWVVFDLYGPMPLPTLYSEGRRLLVPLQNGGQERVTPTTERRPNE